jgi:multiple sugar transport system substrate-binding protein
LRNHYLHSSIQWRSISSKPRVAIAALCAGLLALSPLSSLNAGASSKKVTLSIAFSSDYFMATPAMAPAYYKSIAKQFEATHPNVTVKLVPIPGAESDIITKLSLLYRNASTAPTIAQIDGLDVGKFASAGYLLPLNKYLKTASWWSSISNVVQQEGEQNGNFYSVSQGDNVQALAYNKVDFKKAGLPVPWHPTTWQDVINAALTIKKKLPHLTPVWAPGGTGGGTPGIASGVGNLLAASADPSVYDTKTGKWIVNSKGLTQTFSFIHTLTADDLNAPVSQLFNPDVDGNFLAYMKSPGVAIVIAPNYIGAGWLKDDVPAWPQSATEIGVTPIPTSHDQGSDVASLLSGEDQAIYSGTKNPSLAFQLLSLTMQKENLLTADNDGGLVPSVTAYSKDPLFVNYGAPFQAFYANVERYGTEWPHNGNLPIWAEAFEQATGGLEQSSSFTVKDALEMMQSYVSEQLGSSAVETQK